MRISASDSGSGFEQLLGRFFAAENARDWAAYASLLHPGVEWTLVDDGAERRIVGREDYLAAIAAAYDGTGTAFFCLDITFASQPSEKWAETFINLPNRIRVSVSTLIYK